MRICPQAYYKMIRRGVRWRTGFSPQRHSSRLLVSLFGTSDADPHHAARNGMRVCFKFTLGRLDWCWYQVRQAQNQARRVLTLPKHFGQSRIRAPPRASWQITTASTAATRAGVSSAHVRGSGLP